MKKLAIITSHPIQYNAPLFKKIAERGEVAIKVFYTWSQAKTNFFDIDFNKKIEWNVPLLDGYNYEFVKNISKRPNSRHFRGIICPDLITKIEEWKPEAILVYGWAFQAHFKALRYFKNKIPVFFRGDSTLLDDKAGIKNIFRNLFLKYVYSFVNYAFFVGINNKRYFIKAGLKDSQLIYLPYIIDEELFKDNENHKYNKRAQELRRNLGIKRGETVIAFIGKFIQKKNPEFILKAIQQYNLQNTKKVKLLFIGSGKQEKTLKNMAKNDNNIIFMPFVNQREMPVAYRIADIFVLPSKGPQETWGISINEALACERFVIVSDKVGSAVDLVKNNYNGEIFKSNNFDSFIKKLKKTLKKESFKTNQTKSYSIDKVANIIETYIKNL